MAVVAGGVGTLLPLQQPHKANIIIMGEIFKKDIPVVAPEFRVARSVVAPIVTPGLTMKLTAVAVYDTAGTDSAGVSNKTIAAHPTGVFLPSKAVITNVFFDVVTTFTSATDAATIAYKAQAANDMLSALAISDAQNIHDAGIHAGLIGFPNLGADAAHDSQIEVAALFAATLLKLTAEREITATVAVEALTAGKAVIYVEYYLGA